MIKNIALVAHDGRKKELLEWAEYNKKKLSKCNLYATGTTAKMLTDGITIFNEGEEGAVGFDWYSMQLMVKPLLSGPLGGDSQISAMIAEGKIDCLIFFCDNLITQGHQQDVSALSRLASLYNIAFATNRTTADMILSSPLFDDRDYERIVPSVINHYKNRFENK